MRLPAEKKAQCSKSGGSPRSHWANEAMNNAEQGRVHCEGEFWEKYRRVYTVPAVSRQDGESEAEEEYRTAGCNIEARLQDNTKEAERALTQANRRPFMFMDIYASSNTTQKK